LEQPLRIVPAEQKSDAFAESHCVSCWFIINTCEKETAAYRAGFFRVLPDLGLRIVLPDSALPAFITRPVCKNPLYLRNTIITTIIATTAKIKTKAWYEAILAKGFIDRSINPNAKKNQRRTYQHLYNRINRICRKCPRLQQPFIAEFSE
jgi:hypothetical protein